MDPRAESLPESMGPDGLIAATPDCVAVGTLSEADGPTHIRLQRRSELLGEHPELRRFSGYVATPSRAVLLVSGHGETYATIDVQTDRTAIEVWVNDRLEPDEILILID